MKKGNYFYILIIIYLVSCSKPIEVSKLTQIEKTGKSEIRDLDTTMQKVSNCSGQNETIYGTSSLIVSSETGV